SLAHVQRARRHSFPTRRSSDLNYVERETHFGESVWLTRKGAIRAGRGELGIIPGSMGARSYIVRGTGSAESFQSCAHGAGRRMRSEEHTSELQSLRHLVCRLLL